MAGRGSVAWALAVGLLALAGCAAEGGCGPEKLGVVPVRMVGNLPVVAVRINGREAALILDTGSDRTVVSAAAAARLGIVPAGPAARIGGAGGEVSLGVGRLTEGRLAGAEAVRFDGARVLVGSAELPGLDGILGIDVLVDYELDLDLPRGRVGFARARGCRSAGPGWAGRGLAVQQVPGGQMSVPVVLDGETLRGMLDTGASGTVVLEQAAEDVRVSRARLAALPAMRAGAVNEGGLVVRARRFGRLEIGGVVVERPVLAVAALPAAAGDVLVGEDFLGVRRVWMSFRLGRVVVE